MKSGLEGHLFGAPALFIILAACQTIPRPPEVTRNTDDAHVSSVALKFPKEGEGLCTVELWVPGRANEKGEAGDLVWELWLEGRPFASGVARPELELPPGQWVKTMLKLPLLYRNASWSPDARQVRVRFRGRLIRKFGADAPATALDEQRTLVSEGSPLFDRGGSAR